MCVSRVSCILLGLLFQVLALTNAQERFYKFDHITTDDGLSQNSIHAIVQDKYGFMWFGTWGGLTRYDGYSFTVFNADEDDCTALPDNRINSLFLDSLQNMWCAAGQSNFFYRYNYETENFTRFNKDSVSSYILELSKYAKGNYVKRVRNKLMIVSVKSKKLEYHNRKNKSTRIFVCDKNDPSALSDYLLNVVYADIDNNLWVGTHKGGVNYLNLNLKHFGYYRSLPSGGGLIDNTVKAICKDKDNRLWVGAEDRGITLIDQSDDQHSYTYFDKTQLIDPNIRSLFCDSYGDVWVGTKGGLDRYNSSSKTFKHYYANQPGSICSDWVFSITEDNNGTVWLGTFNGVATYNRATDSFNRLNLDSAIGSKEIRVVKQDSRHVMWIATENAGVSKLTRNRNPLSADTFTIVRYKHRIGDRQSLINNKVFAIAEDSAGSMWFGTSSGLSRLDIKTDSFTHFTIKSGLPNDIIMGIVSDGGSHVWVSHKKGITRININNLQIRNYGAHDGLQGNEFIQNSFFRDTTTNEIFFGGVNGLNSFYPRQIKDDSAIPRVVFTDLKVLSKTVTIGSLVNNRVLLEKSLLATKKLTLTWWDKTFSLQFAALNYANPSSNKYRYKLDGFDNEWIYTDAKMRVASYSNLPAGNYNFVVYATNSDGVWGDKPATMRIDVLPPWWLTIQFKLFFSLLIVSIVLLIFRLRIRALKRNKVELENLVRERTEELKKSNQNLKSTNASKDMLFTIVAHDLKNPFNAILGMSELLTTNYDDFDEDSRKRMVGTINESSNNLYKLLENLLQWARSQTGSIKFSPQEFLLEELISSNFELMLTQAKAKNIVLSHNCSSGFLSYADIDLTNTILRNLLNNAIKFTPSGSISVLVENDEENKQSVVKVVDSGVGMPSQKVETLFEVGTSSSTSGTSGKKGTGLGLIVCKEFVEKNGGAIWVESEDGKGTSFIFTLPMA